tara:strand:- start:53 stop:187 length:135 start_codon:yes stop_codon:yes gene_type:complete
MEDKSTPVEQVVTKTPDENSGVFVESKIKIFDPETKEVYLEGRA